MGCANGLSSDVINQCGTPLPEEALESVRKNKIALKGPISTPIGKGFRSVNVDLRKRLDLYCNFRPSRSIPGVGGTKMLT
ncbi:MAG: isocitrate/isopropylmalate family dehydrogenase [Calditrichia bacterium]